MSVAFTILLAVSLSLQASPGLESLFPASSEANEEHCTETEHCIDYSMAEHHEGKEADTPMESQSESQTSLMDTNEDAEVKDSTISGDKEGEEEKMDVAEGGEGKKEKGENVVGGDNEEQQNDEQGEGEGEKEKKVKKKEDQGTKEKNPSDVETGQGEGEETGEEAKTAGTGTMTEVVPGGGDATEEKAGERSAPGAEVKEKDKGKKGEKGKEAGDKKVPGAEDSEVKEKEGKKEGRGNTKRKKSKSDNKGAATKKPKEETEKEEPLPKFPKTLEEFKYAFNDEGRLRHTKTREPFVFVVKEGNQRFNQAHYEALGEVITEYVYELLEKEGKLKRTMVPVDAKANEPTSFVFESEDARSNEEKLMVLIHGSGVVRAGQWARRLIINDCLDHGTQLPFIHKAREEGYGVVVLNTNRNREEVEGKEKPIRGNSSPEEHAKYVWKHIIEKSAAKEIYIVAHSYGGTVATDLANRSEIREVFQRRVKKIAFTDSVHSFELQKTNSVVKRWLVSHSRNWISCSDPLDHELMIPKGAVPKVSAGTTKHEETSYCAMESIFEYFKELPQE